MRAIRLFITLLGLLTVSSAFSQISHGGVPYFLQPSILRATYSASFVEMPSFDLDSLLREDAVNNVNMRSSYRFAHKFYTDININNGLKTVLPDGTTVKQIGIHSAGAYSINLLLRDFEIPPGGKLFIYSSDHSDVVGSFDYRNNSHDKILPVQPVAGESIIVEYSEPADVPFAGSFTIAEVNHDYRDIFKREPGTDNSNYICMPDVFCEDVDTEIIRSTVLLIINGNTLCSGSLINNTSGEEKPYLLTAVHCFVDDHNKEFPVDMEHYINRAGTIIAFFNYNRPVCDTNIKMKGSEEMSLAGAYPLAVVTRKDIALFEFFYSPPDYYNAYYAGWNCDSTGSSTKYTNLHHPAGAVKKYGVTNGNIHITSLPPPDGNILDANSFWEIPFWTTGSTAGGSSGSPLFDENNLIIGGLTGGFSMCQGMNPNGEKDYFFSLSKAWNQLKTYLDPKNTGVTHYSGMDPNFTNPVIRLANARYTGGDSLITSKLDSPDEGYVFGNSNLQTIEFAEEFTVTDSAEFFGAYLLIPEIPYSYTSGVTVSIYTGETFPEKKIDSISFIPRYRNYSSGTMVFNPKSTNSAPTETFVALDKPVLVSKKFFVSYSINDSSSAQFCVYNTKFNDITHKNTAWVKDESKGWIPADEYEYYPMKTSLAIHSLVRNKKDNQIEIISTQGENYFYYERSGRILTLTEALNKQGQINIYSINGQLLEKMPVQYAQTTFVLKERPKGMIGIVKISSDNFSYTGKIMY